MRRLVVLMKTGTANIPADHMEVADGFAYAYQTAVDGNGKLTRVMVGAFDLGVVDAIYISGSDMGGGK